MSLAVWKARVLTEYKKLKSFSDIERAKQVKKAWKNNCNKLETEIEQEDGGQQKLVKWHNPKSENVETCYLKKCSPIPRGNKWILINSNEKCPLDEENVLHNVPYTNDRDEDIGFVSELLKNHNSMIPGHQGLLLMDDNMLVELVERIKRKYATKNQKDNFLCCKAKIFEGISFYFFNKISPKILMDKYDNLIIQRNCTKTNDKLDNFRCEIFGKERFSQLFCPRCFKYACNQHSNPNVNLNTKLQYNAPYHNKIREKPNKPCGDDCFLNEEFVEGESTLQGSKRRRLRINHEHEHWDSDDLELFRVLKDIFKDNYCVIAKSLLKKSCKQVYQHAIKDKTEVLDPVFETPKNLKKIPRSKKNRALYSAHMKTNEMKKLYPYTPCNHPHNLSCNKNCTCLESQNFCEKFCKCHSELCLNRYIGCMCKSNCDTKKCPCYSYGRECDPDLCKSCEFGTKETRCKNNNMQRGLRKHLLLAPSNIAGWGIFLKNGAKRNEYITEYCGEIITQDEANRRGKLYDQAKSSFLFDLNEEFVIDATRMGSKIRFANHSDKPNCYAKVIKVLGEHRIGIFAKRNIKPDEELSLDYRYGTFERLKFLSANVK